MKSHLLATHHWAVAQSSGALRQSIGAIVYAAGIDVVDPLAKDLGVEAADLLRRAPGLAGLDHSDTHDISAMFGELLL